MINVKKISLITFGLFIIDRISKILITNYFSLNVKHKIINNFFYITYCKNEGAAFSILSGNTLFLIFITFIILFIIYKNIKNKENISNLSIISYSLLLGGILGNLYDRIFYGYVIDFLDFIIFKYNFAIFNLADTFIVIGAFMLLIFEGSDKFGRNKISSKWYR